MITMVLLVIIYLAFISLGLPDSILGVSIPSIQSDFGIQLSSGGLIAMMIVGGTIVSSFASSYIIKKFGTGKITFISCLMTGGALLGISFAPSYVWLLLFAVPLGLGAGSVDTALNNYVALHFKAHHMNWLHSFWGVGATVGPLIMSATLTTSLAWRLGYRIISIIQLSFAAFLFLSIPLWKKHHKLKKIEEDKKGNEEPEASKSIFSLKGVKYAFAFMLLYCAVELGVGLWGSSFLVKVKNLSIESAASWMAMYYGGITVGRFISGFVSFKLSNIIMIRGGIVITAFGLILFFLPLPQFFMGCAFVLTGIGLSPIFPSMLHETPVRFGKANSQKVIGFQMGFAYIGSAVLPPIMGVLFQNLGMTIFPIMMIIPAVLMFFSSEKLNAVVKKP